MQGAPSTAQRVHFLILSVPISAMWSAVACLLFVDDDSFVFLGMLGKEDGLAFEDESLGRGPYVTAYLRPVPIRLGL